MPAERNGRRRLWTSRITWAALAWLGGCSGSGAEPEPVPSLGVVITGPVELPQGGSGATTVAVTRGGGYADVVGLSVEGLSPGIVADFDPPGVPPGATGGTTVLTLSAAPDAPVGTVGFTVVASGPGVPSARASGTVTVSEAPTFSIAVAPAAISVEQGGTGAATVSVARRGGFAGPVVLSGSGLPPGVGVSFLPPDPIGDGATVTLAVGSGVPPGSYPVTITGQGSPGIRTAGLLLTVTPGQPEQTYALRVAPTALTFGTGGSGEALVTIDRAGGYTGAVSLSVTGIPAGVTATFDQATTTGGSATLVLSSASSAVPGTYALVIRGLAPSLPDQTAGLGLTLTAVAGGFSLSAAPSEVVAEVGQTGQSQMSVTRSGGFAGPVTLAALNLPDGVVPTFSPVDAQGRSTLTLAVGASVPSARYPFLVRGSAASQPDQTISMTLTVNPRPGTGNTTVTFCSSAPPPMWVAFKDGSGKWTRVIGTVSGPTTSFSFDFTAATGGIAYVTGSEFSGYSGTVLFGTRSELLQLVPGDCGGTSGGGKTLSGTVAGIAPTDRVAVALGAVSEVAGMGTSDFLLKGAPDGPADLIAIRAQQQVTADGFATTPIGIIVRRGVNYPNGGSIPVLEFSSQAFLPAAASLTLANLGSDRPWVRTDYRTATTEAVIQASVAIGGSTQPLYGVPTGFQVAGDLHRLTLSAVPEGSEDRRTWTGWFTSLGNLAVTLPDPLTPPSVSSLGTAPHVRFQASGPVQANYDDLTSVLLQQALSDGTGRVWSVTATQSYVAAPTYLLALPDFSLVAGWAGAWALQPGVTAEWRVSAAGNAGGGVLPPAMAGGVQRSGTRWGSLVP